MQRSKVTININLRGLHGPEERCTLSAFEVRITQKQRRKAQPGYLRMRKAATPNQHMLLFDVGPRSSSLAGSDIVILLDGAIHGKLSGGCGRGQGLAYYHYL